MRQKQLGNRWTTWVVSAVLCMGGCTGEMTSEGTAPFGNEPDSGVDVDAGSPIGPPPDAGTEPGPETDGGTTQPPAEPSAVGVEQRCADLGTACTCSEPLDTLAFNQNGDNYDPADASTKQCGREDGSTWYQVDTGPDPIEMPYKPASATATYAWKNDSTFGISNIYAWMRSRESRRMCVRIYFALEPGYSDAFDPCYANKLQGLDLGVQPGVSERATGDYNLHVVGSTAGWAGDGRCSTTVGGDPVSTCRVATDPGSAQLNNDDCRGEWCVTETCIRGDLAEGGTNGAVWVEGYIRQIRTGATEFYSDTPIREAGAAFGRSQAIANMFRQGTCSGARIFSHAMLAEWPDDAPGTFIGPSSEMEGCANGVASGCP